MFGRRPNNASRKNKSQWYEWPIIIAVTLMGEILEANEDRVIGRITGCPMLNAHQNLGHGLLTATHFARAQLKA
jgi:hypothetical protein